MKRRSLALLLALAILASLSAATSLTAVAEEEKVELNFVCPSWDVNPPMNDWWIWKEYETKTNIHINWTEISPTVAAERKATMIASNDLPDAFWQFTNITTPELYQYGSEGLFITLDDKAEWMPNLQKLMSDVDSVGPSITMPDGHIYAFPYVMEDPGDASLRYYIKKSWLDNVGLEVPQTIAELETMLEAFKTQDANGNGDANDEYPIYLNPNSFDWTLERQMMGAFGMGDNGLHPIVAGIYADEANELQFIYTDEKLKEMWAMFHKWWEAGYIHPETFSGYDYTTWVADGTNDKVGMYSWVGANILYADAPKDYAAVNQFEGPYSQVLCWIEPPVRGVANGIITSKCENVEAAMRWFDFWYSEEGSNFGLLGTEGTTYNMVDGKPQYVDEILNYEGGSQLGAFQYGLLVYGGYYPYREPAKDLSLTVNNKKYEDVLGCTEADVLKYAPETLWPSFIAMDDEQEILDMYWNDIQTAIKEYRSKFVTGELSLETDWDAYVSALENIGLSEVMDVRKTQYERYLASVNG